FFDGVADGLCVGHGMRERFFDVRVAAGSYCFDAVKGVLEIGGGDDNSLDILVVIKLVVVARERELLSIELVCVGGAFIAAAMPDVREGYKFKIQRRR